MLLENSLDGVDLARRATKGGQRIEVSDHRAGARKSDGATARRPNRTAIVGVVMLMCGLLIDWFER